ncbi:hypothetical protein Tco_0897966, partial [Tanacetum coccineum]
MDLFAFIRHADPTKAGPSVPVGYGDHNDDLDNVGTYDLNEESGDAELRDQTKEGVHVVQDEGVNIVADDEIQAIIVDKPKGTRRKRKAASGASSSVLPPKKLREDHGTSSDAGASTAGKSLSALQGLLERSTLAIEVGVTAAATMLFVTSFVTLMPEHAEVSSFDRSSVPPVPVMTTAVATIATADVASPSQPAGTELSTNTFYVSQEMDSETLQHIYVPKWNMINDSALDEPEASRQTCLGSEVRMRCEHNLREKKDSKINVLDRRGNSLSATNFMIIDCMSEATRLVERQNSLKSILGFLEEEKCDFMMGRGRVSDYELFKEHFEAVQDEQVKVLSDRVAELDSELISMAIHLDEEFYPRFLTTIAGRRWILSRGIRLDVMKCLQSSGYVVTLGEAIVRAIDKNMQPGLVAGIDHGKAGRGLADVASYDPSTEAKYVSAVLAFHNLDFEFISLLESRKDASITDIMDSLRLEGPFAETPEISRLQPSHEHLLLLVHRKEDNVVIRETSLSESLDAVHAQVQKVKEGGSSHRLSISDVMDPLVNLLSFENLVGEASTSGVPVTVTVTTTLSTTFAHTISIPPISLADYACWTWNISLKLLIPPRSSLNKKLWSLRRSTSQPVEPALHCGASRLWDIILSFTTVCTTVMCDLFGAVVCT